MFFDDGYDTDDTDELLASKMCANAPAVVAHADRVDAPAIRRSDEGSCLVQEDWLFSLDCGERRQSRAALAFSAHRVLEMLPQTFRFCYSRMQRHSRRCVFQARVQFSQFCQLLS